MSTPNTGDEQRFEELYRTHRDELYHYAVILLQGRNIGSSRVYDVAEEAVQEAFSVAWKKRYECFSSPSPVGWLHKALYHKVQEICRENRKWAIRILRLSEHAGSSTEGDFRLKSELLSCISVEEYSLLKHVYLDGYTYKELSQAMHIKPSTLAMRVKRIKDRINKEHGDL